MKEGGWGEGEKEKEGGIEGLRCGGKINRGRPRERSTSHVPINTVVVVVLYLSSGFSAGCAGPLAAVDWLRGSNCCPG